MKERVVGIFSLGNDQIELVLREGTGGEFYAVPGKGKIPRIAIGADKEGVEVLSTVIHEVFEFSTFRNHCRYDPSGDYSNDHSAYLFVMSHPQLSDCCGHLAVFLNKALPELEKSWKAWKKKGGR
jgi:hypothetical protein